MLSGPCQYLRLGLSCDAISQSSDPALRGFAADHAEGQVHVIYIHEVNDCGANNTPNMRGMEEEEGLHV